MNAWLEAMRRSQRADLRSIWIGSFLLAVNVAAMVSWLLEPEKITGWAFLNLATIVPISMMIGSDLSWRSHRKSMIKLVEEVCSDADDEVEHHGGVPDQQQG